MTITGRSYQWWEARSPLILVRLWRGAMIDIMIIFSAIPRSKQQTEMTADTAAGQEAGGDSGGNNHLRDNHVLIKNTSQVTLWRLSADVRGNIFKRENFYIQIIRFVTYTNFLYRIFCFRKSIINFIWVPVTKQRNIYSIVKIKGKGKLLKYKSEELLHLPLYSQNLYPEI